MSDNQNEQIKGMFRDAYKLRAGDAYSEATCGELQLSATRGGARLQRTVLSEATFAASMMKAGGRVAQCCLFPGIHFSGKSGPSGQVEHMWDKWEIPLENPTFSN